MSLIIKLILLLCGLLFLTGDSLFMATFCLFQNLSEELSDFLKDMTFDTEQKLLQYVDSGLKDGFFTSTIVTHLQDTMIDIGKDVSLLEDDKKSALTESLSGFFPSDEVIQNGERDTNDPFILIKRSTIMSSTLVLDKTFRIEFTSMENFICFDPNAVETLVQFCSTEPTFKEDWVVC